MKYVVVENTPGCLPESEPFECETIQEAWAVASEKAVELLEFDYAVSRFVNGELEEEVWDETRVRELDDGKDGINAFTGFESYSKSPYDLGRVVEITKVE